MPCGREASGKAGRIALADAARLTMTPKDVFVWPRDRDELRERVDGHPAPRQRMTTRASLQHDRATGNVIGSLSAQLHGTARRPTTADVALRTRIRGLCRPDVMGECAPLVPDTDAAREPKLVVEVASPSTTTIDQTRKVEAYKRHPRPWPPSSRSRR